MYAHCLRMRFLRPPQEFTAAVELRERLCASSRAMHRDFTIVNDATLVQRANPQASRDWARAFALHARRSRHAICKGCRAASTASRDILSPLVEPVARKPGHHSTAAAPLAAVASTSRLGRSGAPHAPPLNESRPLHHPL